MLIPALLLPFLSFPSLLACMLILPLSHFLPAEVKSTETVGPVLIHVVTEKGRGYLPAETASDKMHGVTQYDTVTGQQKAAKASHEMHMGSAAPCTEARRCGQSIEDSCWNACRECRVWGAW